MFKYKVEVKNSKNPKMGLGLFANEVIKSDTIVWEFIEGLDIRIDEDTLNKLNDAQREFFKKYGWKEDDGNYYSSCDLTNFINHSFTPNLICVGEIILSSFFLMTKAESLSSKIEESDKFVILIFVGLFL